MLAVGSYTNDLQQNSALTNPLFSTEGDELPTLSCDLGDVNSSEFEQLLQGLSDPFLLDLNHMQFGSSAGGDMGHHHQESSCDLTSFFLEDVGRPRDISLSFPGEYQHGAGQTTAGILGSKQPPSTLTMGLGQSTGDQKSEPVSFFHHPAMAGYQSVQKRSSTSSAPSLFDLPGDATPPHSSGVTPQGGSSRAVSPAWSESSGNMSCSSVSSMRAVFTGTCVGGQRSRHHSRSSVASTASTSSVVDVAGDNQGALGSSSIIPRHKRPSHKRAEIKRRDKIKTCLEDMKEAVPSLREKGKLSESAILIKAAEYIHHLKDGQSDRGKKCAELQLEIDCLSKDIHLFQENLPAAGLKEESISPVSLDDLYDAWRADQSQNSKFCIFSAITSKMWESFKLIVGPATTLAALSCNTQEWQAKSLALTVLRKQILAGLLNLSRQDNMVISQDSLRMEFGSSVDAKS